VPLAFVMIDAVIGKEGEVLDQLKKIEHVKQACLIFGAYDIVAKIEAETWDKLREVITSRVRTLNAVRSTLTTIVAEGT
jgi:DNA-binding Lrp family transcriptional regulator